jgi:hypothetical protein
MSYAYLVGLHYASLVLNMYLGVIGNHAERKQSRPRGYKMGELQAPDLSI